jgi:hypothetical protein
MEDKQYLKIGEALIGEEQVRNSATNKLRTVLENKINTIDITNVPVQTAEFSVVSELVNPEQWAVPEGRVSKVEKSNKS